MLKILIIEDDYLYAKELSKALQQYECIALPIASNAADGLDLYQQGQPDMVLIDLELDKARKSMDGIDFVHAMSRVDERDVPYLYITAHYGATSPYYKRALETGYAGFLPKAGIHLSQIWDIVQTAFDKWLMEHNRFMEAGEAWGVFRGAIFIKKQAYNTYVKVPLIDIACIIYEKPYCHIFTATQHFKIRIGIGELTSTLALPYFVQINQCYTINIHFVEEYDSEEQLVKIQRSDFTCDNIKMIRQLITDKSDNGFTVSDRRRAFLLDKLQLLESR
jgi:DNA-binding LytR/AlgR family response regulator